jgi:hypothetical protein
VKSLPNLNAAWMTSEGVPGEHSLPSDNTPHQLRCLIKGEAAIFPVLVAGNEDTIKILFDNSQFTEMREEFMS